MSLHTIKRGLDIPLLGSPRQEIEGEFVPERVAVLGVDYPGIKPRLLVAEGEQVKRGQPVFEDKSSSGILFCTPLAGVVEAINRGERRALLSVVIKVSEAERSGHEAREERLNCQAWQQKSLANWQRGEIEELLLHSGLWAAFRTRPFGRVPKAKSSPEAIFVQCIDTEPLAPSPEVVLLGQEEEFKAGLVILSALAPKGRVFLCRAKGSSLPVPDLKEGLGISVEEFAGPHPAGLPSTHIHLLSPVSRHKMVWHIGYQDVAAVGHLFLKGFCSADRVISLAGPAVKNPRLVRVPLGANLEELAKGEVAEGEARLISGSPLSGRAAGEHLEFLGRYHLQLTVLKEDRRREFLGWLKPGSGECSASRTFLSSLLPNKRFPLTTSLKGSLRAIVPIEAYERVMPLDIEATALLRALLVGDIDHIEQLGGLELIEEDLGLSTFVCPSKIDYLPPLRSALDELYKELA